MPRLKRFTLKVLIGKAKERVGPVGLPDFGWASPTDFVGDVGRVAFLLRRIASAIDEIEDEEQPGYRYFPKVGLSGKVKQMAAIRTLLSYIPIPKPLLIGKLVFNFLVKVFNDLWGHDWDKVYQDSALKMKDNGQ